MRRTRFCRRGLVAAACLLGAATAARAQSVEELRSLSISELANVTVTSVSKEPEALSGAPAAIYVITHDEILRSGLRRIPDILRLAPNLYVGQTSASEFVVTPRGLSGLSSAQNFSNKLLVLIDGRSVYNPIFSGMNWDMQDVTPEDIDRIEVTSGPGGALWGSNAFNGVINIITRKAFETQGGLVSVSSGNHEDYAGLRYGGRLNEISTYRLYLRAQHGDDSYNPAGGHSLDHWRRVQSGFRIDVTPSGPDSFTLSGDAYYGDEAQVTSYSGANILGRWTSTGSNGSTLQVQSYLDFVRRGHELTGGSPSLIDTFDVDAQDSFGIGSWNSLVVGGGVRAARYHTVDQGGLLFRPNRRTLLISNLFVQDTATLSPQLNLVLGLKVESDAYSTVSALPNLRISWTPRKDLMLWGSASEAVRAPTPFDRDVREVVGTTLFIKGNPEFEAERVRSYELGARWALPPRVSVSATLFYNRYRDLKTIELTPVTILPLLWGNRMEGDAYGLEAWGDYQATSWWRLRPSVRLLSQHMNFTPGASKLVGLSEAGDDARNNYGLQSNMDLGPRLKLDADLRYQGRLPDPMLPAYTELNTRLAWSATNKIEIALLGQNLLHDHHQEYAGGAAIARSVSVQVRARF